MSKFQSVKVMDGFSTVFRQWKATTTHCSYLHGYAVSFKLIFEGDLDEKNWVWDFGGFKRATNKIDGFTPNDWFKYMFDHTTVVAADDPQLDLFRKMDEKNIIQLRIVPSTGCEKFAQFVHQKVSEFIEKETEGRVKLISVECREHEKNSSLFIVA